MICVGAQPSVNEESQSDNKQPTTDSIVENYITRGISYWFIL